MRRRRRRIVNVGRVLVHNSPPALASSMNFSGSVTLGNAYMAPCAGWHDTPSSALSPATSLILRRFMLARM